MKIDLNKNGAKTVRMESENTSDVFLLGKLAAKLRNAQHHNDRDTHVVECDQQEFLKLALDGCKP